VLQSANNLVRVIASPLGLVEFEPLARDDFKRITRVGDSGREFGGFALRGRVDARGEYLARLVETLARLLQPNVGVNISLIFPPIRCTRAWKREGAGSAAKLIMVEGGYHI
jgi:hypothetical protein